MVVFNVIINGSPFLGFCLVFRDFIACPLNVHMLGSKVKSVVVLNVLIQGLSFLGFRFVFLKFLGFIGFSLNEHVMESNLQPHTINIDCTHWHTHTLANTHTHTHPPRGETPVCHEPMNILSFFLPLSATF